MRKLFLEHTYSFFKHRLEVDISKKNHGTQLGKKLEEKNIMKSKIVNLLPSTDLHTVVDNPCFVSTPKSEK